MMNLTTANIRELDKIAVDVKELASNFTSVIPECNGRDLDPATEIVERHPVLNWILNSELTNRILRDARERGMNCVLVEKNDGFYLNVPGLFWSLVPNADGDICCFPPMDFAKCESDVLLTRICVKDCDSIDHELLGRFLRVDRSYGGLVNSGDDYNEVRRKIAMRSMAFYMARNMMLGKVGSTAPGLRSFHGLFEVMSNPAIVAIPGASTLSAFEAAACRIQSYGNDFENYIIAVNPIIHRSLLQLIERGRDGRYPNGWMGEGDSLSFHGARVMADSFIPFNMNTNTGDAFLLSSDSVGGWMATDLLPGNDYIKRGPYTEESVADGCGSECVYYYNYGAVFNNNSARLARITGIPVSSYCAAGTGDLGSLINPETLIPKY